MASSEMKWFLSPRRDKFFQWWWGYRKVKMVKLSDEYKQAFLKMHNSFL